MPARPPLEPFRIKSVQPFRVTTCAERTEILERAHHNLFLVHADDVMIDLLTDSGTAAMSSAQWGALMRGDESYAGSASFFRFESVVKDLTGFKHVIPTHQGRAAERILFSLVGGKGKAIPSNTHFDTTRANIEHSGAEAGDLRIPESKDPTSTHSFKGNIDLPQLESFLRSREPGTIPLGMITITSNTAAGQPVCVENIRQAKRILARHGIPLYLDACRFAENAWLVKERDPGYRKVPVRQIAREIFSLADGCTMSAKKDGLANMGGFLATNDDELAERARRLLILTEGFPTYGGMAGRDLEAVAQGLTEVLDEYYLAYRTGTLRWMTDSLHALGIPVYRPAAGHAVYLDAHAFLPNLPRPEYPGQALACALYREGGIRSVEVGSVMFGRCTPDGGWKPADLELVRLAFPRRAYTQSHLAYVIDIVERVYKARESIGGYRITWEPPHLRHFTAHFEPLDGKVSCACKEEPAVAGGKLPAPSRLPRVPSAPARGRRA